MELEYEVTAKITKLDIEWDLYWGSDWSKISMVRVNSALTTAAKRAVAHKDRSIFYKAAEKYAEYGAADSEPIGQFNYIWEKVYGYESVYGSSSLCQ